MLGYNLNSRYTFKMWVFGGESSTEIFKTNSVRANENYCNFIKFPDFRHFSLNFRLFAITSEWCRNYHLETSKKKCLQYRNSIVIHVNAHQISQVCLYNLIQSFVRYAVTVE